MSDKQPNIIFIMADDHAAHAMSCYGSRINKTPNLDRIASEGMRFDNCFCTNSICAPSRAAILTGTYNHVNGVTTLHTTFDGRKTTFPKLLQAAGYQTAIIGKWHLGHGGVSDPTGFDYWNVLDGQGYYKDPEFFEMGELKTFEGYVTDLITDFSIDWMRNRDKKRPFLLCCHHKAPHRTWIPDEKHANMYKDHDIPEPDTFNDDYSNRAAAAAEAKMRIDRDLEWFDVKLPPPDGLTPEQQEAVDRQLAGYFLPREKECTTPEEEKKWKYQRYIKDYLRCVASIDDNVGRMLDFLEEEGLAEDTVIVYTSDQGFFLGDHNWYDKRFMYEESLRMPFVIRYPREVKPNQTNDDIVINVDFAQTFLDLAAVNAPESMQGASFRPLLQGHTPADWRTGMYYRYWQHLSDHGVGAHYGIRTHDYKLIYYYGQACGQPGAWDDPREPEWELFDLRKDANEMCSVYGQPEYAAVTVQLKEHLHRIQAEVGDVPQDEIE